MNTTTLCPHCRHEIPNGTEYCPRCQNRLSASSASKAGSPSFCAPTDDGGDKPYHATIVGHGLMKAFGKSFFSWWSLEDLAVDVWVDGVFAGTIPPDGRLDLHLDKNPVEIRMCIKGVQEEGRWTTILQRLDHRCCFKIAPSYWQGFRILRLVKILES